MAHIVPNKGKWRAQIYRGGIRKSKTFLTEREATDWANVEETRATRRFQRTEAQKMSSLASHMPKRVLNAIKATDYTCTEVTEHCVPYRTSCGVYFLIHNEEVVYVGQSIDILGRISRHRREGKVFDAFNYIECLAEEAGALEASYIVAFMPWLNLALGRVPEAA